MEDLNIYKEAAKVRGFYDVPLWNGKEPKIICHDLFEWNKGLGFESGGYSGKLKEELFDTDAKKIYYLKGVLEDSGLRDNKIYLANSHNKVERFKKWAGDIAYKNHLYKLFFGAIIEHNIKYLCPICHTLELNPNLVKFIQDYQ